MTSHVVMNSSDAVDLALLGLLVEGARQSQDLVRAIKLVGGDRFTPTAAFIEGRIGYLTDCGHLAHCMGDDRLSVTSSGTALLGRLLRLEIDPGPAALRAFCTMLKLSLLNRVGAACRREVGASLVGAEQRRADQLETAGWEAHAGTMMGRCLALEQQRAAFELRWMQDVMVAEGIGETVA